VEAERRALTQARRLLTPHHELARLFTHKAVLLEWAVPAAVPRPAPGRRILFPASALARKGAYEMRRLAQELHLPLVVAGRAVEHAGFWQEVATTPAGPDPLAGVGLVVYPAAAPPAATGAGGRYPGGGHDGLRPRANGWPHAGASRRLPGPAPRGRAGTNGATSSRSTKRTNTLIPG
jgi:hypothetical protein